MQSRYFGDKAFYKNALAVAVPIMIQNAITGFVNMLDNIMVGTVGTVQMSGVAIANTLLFVMQLALFGAVAGAGIFSAQFFGKKDMEGVKFTLRYKIMFSLLITAIGISIFCTFGETLIMQFLKGEGDLEDIAGSLRYGKSYLSIVLIGYPAFAIAQSYAGTLRESGQTLPPMIASLIAIAINLCLNAVLIFGLLGFPALGSDGAAIATVISRYAEAAVTVYFAHRSKNKNPYVVGLYKSMYIPSELFKKITLKGMPLVINEIIWSGSLVVVNQCYSIRGYDVVAAINICSSINNVCNVTYLAMGASIGIIVGQLLGAGKFDEAKDADRKLIIFSLITCIIPISLMLGLSNLFPMIFDTTDSIRELAGSFMRVMAAVIPFSALANAIYFTLRTGGKTWITILFDSCFVCVVSAPVAFVLSRYTSLPIVPLYFFCQELEAVKCVIGLIILKSGKWVNNLVGVNKEAEANI